VTLFAKHRDEMSIEERVEFDVAENLKRQKAAHLEAMKEELVGVVAKLRQAEAEKIRLSTENTSGFNGTERIEHATALAFADEEVITLTARVAHIEQQIRKS
jgi:septum formation topological specificity factor MinE